MKKVLIEFKVKDKPILGGEFEKFANWLAGCPIPSERIKQIHEKDSSA